MKYRILLSASALLLSFSASVSAYDVVNVDDSGSISGVIRLDGEFPQEETTIIGKDNHICGEGHAVMNPVTIDADNGLVNVVVSIAGIESGKDWEEKTAFSIVQENCKFSPYVQVMKKDQTIQIVNKDPLLHNIHTYELIGNARRTMFNIAQPRADQVDEQKLKLRKGNVVEIACDAHNWMTAYIYTTENPYFSITDSSGSFQIDGIPPGDYEVNIWHPTIGSVSKNITVESESQNTMEVALSSN